MNAYTDEQFTNRESIVIYTAIFGKRDILREPKVVSKNCRYVCFTDQLLRSRTWEVRSVSGLFRHPRRSARQYKILSHLYFPDCEFSVWIDGRVTPALDPVEFVRTHLADRDIAVFRHPVRDCLYDEGTFCKDMQLDLDHLLTEQLACYRSAGYPEHHGLADLCVLLRRHTPAIRHFNAAWWSELCRHSSRDQISFAFAAWREAIHYGVIPGFTKDWSLFEFHLHAARAPRIDDSNSCGNNTR